MSSDFMTFPSEARVGEVLRTVRHSGRDPQDVSYLYVVGEDGRSLLGVVDLRELVLAADHLKLAELMASPVVSAEEEDMQEDLAEIFSKYHYRMIPVVDTQDRLLGIIRYKDIMKDLVPQVKE